MTDTDNSKNSRPTAPADKTPPPERNSDRNSDRNQEPSNSSGTGDSSVADNVADTNSDTTSQPAAAKNAGKTLSQSKPQGTAEESAPHSANKTAGKPASEQSKAAEGKAKTAPKPAVTKPKRPFPVLATLVATLALILALAAGGAGYWNYTLWQTSELQTRSLGREADKLRSQLGELQQQISAVQRQDLDLNLGVEQLRSDQKLQNDSVKQLSQQFQALATDKGKDPVLWRVAEVEYLLSVANHRLQLERDVNTALVALQDADRRLESIADPALIPVRKLIASESTALKSVDVPDITGMALRLSALVDNIEKLPLVNRERVKTDIAMGDTQVVNSVNELMARILKDLKGVVSIRRSEQPIEPLLPPEEQHYLSQNLGLKLEEARLALLRRDTADFRQNLADAGEWVKQYFDPDSAAVSNVIAAVDDLQGVELKPQLPDISDSLRELRRWLTVQQQQHSAAHGSDSTTQHHSEG